MRHAHGGPRLLVARELPAVVQHELAFRRPLLRRENGLDLLLDGAFRALVGSENVPAQIVRHPALRPRSVLERSVVERAVGKNVVSRSRLSVGPLGIERRIFALAVVDVHVVVPPGVFHDVVDVRAVPSFFARRNRRERLNPLFRRRIAADVVAVAAKRHGDGIDRFPDEDLRARYLLGAALARDGEDERAEDHESEDDDGVEDDALLHRRCSAAERRALRGILALDRLDSGDAFLLLRVLRRELLPKRVVVDHVILLESLTLYHNDLRKFSRGREPRRRPGQRRGRWPCGAD